MKERIEWIDTAKGIAILLIVLEHTTSIDKSYLGVIFTYISLPIFYVMSGCFYKQVAFKTFIFSKLNNLIIPTLFFFWGACFIYAMMQGIGVYFMIPFKPVYLLDIFMPTEEIYCNGVVWFLMSLFWVNILYYFIQKFLSSYCFIAIIICAILGVSGIVHLPYFIDTSLTALPFFYFGVKIKEWGILGNWKFDNKLWMIIIMCSIFVVLFAQHNSMRSNEYNNSILYHITALSGVSMVLALCKKIGKVSILSTIYGRYSLIVLGTHALLINPIRRFSANYLDGNDIFTFAMVSLIELIVIPVFVKFFPYCCAQKNIFTLLSNEK